LCFFEDFRVYAYGCHFLFLFHCISLNIRNMFGFGVCDSDDYAEDSEDCEWEAVLFVGLYGFPVSDSECSVPFSFGVGCCEDACKN